MSPRCHTRVREYDKKVSEHHIRVHEYDKTQSKRHIHVRGYDIVLLRAVRPEPGRKKLFVGVGIF